jgi:hypothetical protein
MLFYRRIKHNIQSLWTILNLNTQGFERWYFILVALVATMAVKSYFSNIDPSANWVATGVVVLLVSAPRSMSSARGTWFSPQIIAR